MSQKKLISSIRRQITSGNKGAGKQRLSQFFDQYFATVPMDDLRLRSAGQFAGVARSHFNLATKWKSGQRKVRVFNPTENRDGWISEHTIVQIITADMPFLVDSVSMELNRLGFNSHLTMHPIMGLVRNKNADIKTIAPASDVDSANRVSFIHAEIDLISDKNQIKDLEDNLNRVLEDVRIAVADWKKMIARLEGIISEVENCPARISAKSKKEAKEFLQWLLDGHFTFLGLREYDLKKNKSGTTLQIVSNSGLGILRTSKKKDHSFSFDKLPEQLKKQATDKNILTLTKSNTRATIHRPAYLDYIGIKRFSSRGEVIGEYRILGLYTSAAYLSNPSTIPLVSNKIDNVVQRSGLLPGSHVAKALLNILQTYPREELIQASSDDLYHSAMGIVDLQERQRVRVFIRRDTFDRFIACLVYVPKERFHSAIRQKIQDILCKAFNGTHVDFSTSISESPYAQLYLVVHTRPGQIPKFNLEEIEAAVSSATQSWDDKLASELVRMYGEKSSAALFRRYCGNAFSAAYQDDHSALNAAYDIRQVEAAIADNSVKLVVYRVAGKPDYNLDFKLFNLNEEIPLSAALPILENMGLYVESQYPYEITPCDSGKVWVHDFGMRVKTCTPIRIEDIRENFEEAFSLIWSGKIENDGLNKLVLNAGLSAREIMILRAYVKYTRQIGTAFSQLYIEDALNNHTQIAAAIVRLFITRFDPDLGGDRNKKTKALVKQITSLLDNVASLDEDRILRRFFDLVQATLRTNYYQQDETGEGKSYLSLKLAPRSIPDLPLPYPAFEIFVYSPRVEGVHLRGGKVARGGLRWSDRREDFRTEILGLMRSQMVKNAVIVPVGAKGGFYVKQPPPSDRAALVQEGIACYKTFIRGLLDITDNRKRDRIIPPKNVVRYDDDDPYLVVAADKGTATFSDIANEVAAEYGFWLGDAFASGGSAGYDHKKMGITARGAWESVKHHFQILDHDTQRQEFSVIGIGDMSGDVFGNGMLLSSQIRLIGAFNHMHIFLDPDPDAAQSFAERKRLFKLSGSTWADYNQKLISRGGGIYGRSLKSITLTPEVKKMLGVALDKVDPASLIRLLLAAPVDMIWNGGIGTYIKAESEQHSEVGDKANDGVRIDSTRLQARVIGEGGNLGISQLGRLEFANQKGHINADWIDNSGGVHCSDREVNIKILLNELVNRGKLGIKERNRLLVKMTRDVATMVLQDNYRQARAITTTEVETRPRLGWYMYLLLDLDELDGFNRQLEHLPDHLTVDKRRAGGEGLSRPEIATILAFTKAALAEEIKHSDLPDEPYMCGMLERYFPALIRDKYRKEIRSHQLRREIISTLVTNSMVNRAGITFAHRMSDESGASIAEITRAYLIARDVFSITGLWSEIDRLDYKVAVEDQMLLVFETQHLMRHAVRWFLRHNEYLDDITKTVELFHDGVQIIEKMLEKIPAGKEWDFIRETAKKFRATGVPAKLALRFASLRVILFALEITRLANSMKQPVDRVSQTFFSLGTRIRMNEIYKYANILATDTIWQDRARTEFLQDLILLQGEITADALSACKSSTAIDKVVEQWVERNNTACERYAETLDDFQYSDNIELAMLSVILGKLRTLKQGN